MTGRGVVSPSALPMKRRVMATLVRILEAELRKGKRSCRNFEFLVLVFLPHISLDAVSSPLLAPSPRTAVPSALVPLLPADLPLQKLIRLRCFVYSSRHASSSSNYSTCPLLDPSQLSNTRMPRFWQTFYHPIRNRGERSRVVSERCGLPRT